MGILKVGLIGAGTVSEMHLQSYDQNLLAELYAVCDENVQRAKEKAKKYEASKVYADYRDLLADPNIDAVSVCVWNKFHAEISIAALESGKHVLVEKPPAIHLEDTLAMEEAVQRTGKLLHVGLLLRHATNTKILKKFIDGGDLGDIYYAKASWLRRLGNPGGWFADKDLAGGGPLLDLGVHVIDVCWYLMGRPKVKSVSGNTYRKVGNRANIKNLSFYQAADYDPSKNTVEDMANALIKFENGASLMVDVSYTLHFKNKESISVELFGTEGGAVLQPELLILTEKYDTILNTSPQVNETAFDFEQAFQAEIDHFVECCIEGKTTNSPIQDGVELMKILTGIYQSSETGEEIYFIKSPKEEQAIGN